MKKNFVFCGWTEVYRYRLKSNVLKILSIILFCTVSMQRVPIIPIDILPSILNNAQQFYKSHNETILRPI